MNTLQKEEKGEIFLVNAFSPNMLNAEEAQIHIKKIDVEIARALIHQKKIISYIGHPITVQILSILLGIPVEVNRSQLKVEKGELIIFILNGRLPEGQVITSTEEINKIGYTLWYVEIR